MRYMLHRFEDTYNGWGAFHNYDMGWQLTFFVCILYLAVRFQHLRCTGDRVLRVSCGGWYQGCTSNALIKQRFLSYTSDLSHYRFMYGFPNCILPKVYIDYICLNKLCLVPNSVPPTLTTTCNVHQLLK